MGTKKFDAAVVKGWRLRRGWRVDPVCSQMESTCTCIRDDDPRLAEATAPQQPSDWTLGRTVSPWQSKALSKPKAAGRGATSPKTTSRAKAGLADNNPKTRVGALKAPLHLVPPSAEFYLAQALADGAEKYGAYNWREEPISVSVYVGAIKRHMAAYWDGEDDAADSGVHHLAHVMACCALLLDSGSIGQLQDDRPVGGAVAALMEEYKA